MLHFLFLLPISMADQPSPLLQNQSLDDANVVISSIRCGANSHLTSCFPCDGTCTKPRPVCPLSCDQGTPTKCQCDAGYVRNEHDRCILFARCPPQSCPSNQVWKRCPTICEPSCLNLYPECDFSKCDEVPKCQCMPGFYRLSSSSNAPCVPWKKCKPVGGVLTKPRPPIFGHAEFGKPFDWWGLAPDKR
ncbi:hypothetical protein PMAYCL1PPCAC_28901 [Pristionchus mayeri]|uniref:TIL domain-containing protein n=1 Tax=Pristionchus mayeri TaxID=1317129 RepID=A0AAN5D942_9BILA|nr:hypothetical protein PMAYCL1PPCAC_28901 [Pristionchus mayeri]